MLVDPVIGRQRLRAVPAMAFARCPDCPPLPGTAVELVVRVGTAATTTTLGEL